VILYTIGFAGKSAEAFFDALRRHRVGRVIDIRANPRGQLSGYAKQRDLPFFLARLADGCGYTYVSDLAPSREMLTGYRADADWPGYVARFEALMDERSIPDALDRELFESRTPCLLCSEALPERCHRRLVAERLAACWPDVEVRHL
jgi:uncharacterized protein (DUF488 family)